VARIEDFVFLLLGCNKDKEFKLQRRIHVTPTCAGNDINNIKAGQSCVGNIECPNARRIIKLICEICN